MPFMQNQIFICHSERSEESVPFYPLQGGGVGKADKGGDIPLSKARLSRIALQHPRNPNAGSETLTGL